MFEYLTHYGVQKQQMNYRDIDINDRLLLEEQINESRKQYSNLLNLLDEIQGKYIQCSAQMAIRSKEIISAGGKNSAFSTDDNYIELEAEMTALKSGMNMVNANIEYCKNDLRILNSVFYNKF